MQYSTNRYRCPFCRKALFGIVPRGGDGSGYIFPRHKGTTPESKHRGLELCLGSRTLIDFEKDAQDNQHTPARGEGEKHGHI